MKEPIWNQGKEAAALAALELIHSGMLVGLGTGSTIAYFLRALSERCLEGLQITGVASSLKTQAISEELGIPLIKMEELSFLDVTVDGADEIDLNKQMIKGGGGALLREKILASNSGEMIVIVDETKYKPNLGHVLLPIEVLPFAATAILTQLERLGYKGRLRERLGNGYFETDNGNYIFDIEIAAIDQPPREIDQKLRAIVGVLETGFFFNLATTLIVGYDDGHVEKF